MPILERLKNHKLLLITVGIYFLTRFIMIWNFPLFFDEAIYIHWAQHILEDPFWKWVSLIDGKQPLFIWLVSLFHIVIWDPILAGRFVSVLCGVGSMGGMYLLTNKLSNQKTALVTAALYVTIPFYLIYDSLALMDSLLMTLSVYTAYFSYRFATEQKPLFAGLVGVCIGFGLLTKSSAQFFFLYPLLMLLFLPKINLKTLGRYFLFLVLAGLLAKGLESIMRFSSYYAVVAQKNSEFSKPLSEVLTNLPAIFDNNGKQVISWIVSYFSIPILLTAIVSGFLLKKKIYVIFLLFSFIPLITTTIIGEQLYPRHVLFMTWPLLLLVAFFLVAIQEKFFKIVTYALPLLLIVISSFSLFMTTKLLIQPRIAGLTEKEQWQFFTGPPSGVGLHELNNKISTYAENEKKLLILTDTPLGILPDGIGQEFFWQENVFVKGTDEINKETFAQHVYQYKPSKVLLITSHQESPRDIESKKILEIEREGETNYNWKLFEAAPGTFKFKRGKLVEE